MAIYIRDKQGDLTALNIPAIKGEDGITPNISIGTVTTLEAGEQATVTREGTKENPVFNFGIPKGESGDSSSSNNASIDDNTIATDKTWSSSKIEDFVHTNDDVIWSTVQGENLSIDYTKEGYLREIEIWGNTWQDTYYSKNLFDKDNINLLKGDKNTPNSYTVENNTVKFECPTSFNQMRLRFELDRNLDTSKTYVLSGSNIRAFTEGEWVTEGIGINMTTILEGNIFETSFFVKDWKPITKLEITNLQIEEGNRVTSYEPYHKADLSDIQHLGTWNEEKQVYEIEIESCNFYKKDLFYLGNNVADLNLESTFIKHNDVRNSKFSIELECGDFDDGDILFFDASHSLRLFKEGKYLKLENFNFDAGVVTKTFNCNKGDIISIVNDGSIKLYINGNFIENASYQVNYGNIRVVQEISFLKINTINIPQNYLLKSKPISHKTTLLLPCQLMKVGDTSDRLYWDNSKGRYVIEKNIYKYSFVELDIISKSQNDNATFHFGIDNVVMNPIFHDGSLSYLPIGICNKGLCQAPYNIYWGNGSPNCYGKNTFGVSSNRNNKTVSFAGRIRRDEGVGDIVTAKQWIKDNDVYCYYRLQTPELIDTDIREELKLPTFINNTYITVTGGIQGSIKAKAPIDGGKAIQSLSAQNTVLTLENEEMKVINKEQDELINTTMLAANEMYMMLEPLLTNMLIDNETISPLVNMYVAMIKRGLLKTIDEVPEKYRNLVKKNI